MPMSGATLNMAYRFPLPLNRQLELSLPISLLDTSQHGEVGSPVVADHYFDSTAQEPKSTKTQKGDAPRNRWQKIKRRFF
jgi:hypothetical protein